MPGLDRKVTENSIDLNIGRRLDNFFDFFALAKTYFSFFRFL